MSTTTRILHVTDAASSGVLAAVTSFARAQAAVPGTDVTFAYVPRADSPSLETIREMATPAVRVQRLTASSRLAVPVLAARLPLLLAGRDHDVIHVHSSRAGLLGRLAGLVTGRRGRVVYSPHCFAFDRTDGSAGQIAVFRGLEQLGALAGPRLVLCSGSEERLARRTLPGVRTAVLRNSVDTAALAAIPAPASTPSRPLRVVHVGRIAAQKRPGEFGRIASRWHAARAASPASRPEVEFRWIGEGDRTALPPEVSVSGWLEPSRLREELAAADILLFTSAGEGMPLSVIEAQAMGIPVVSHAVTGVTDVVRDGETGLLAESTDDLEAALVRLASDPAERERLGAAAAEHARAGFDIGDLAERSFAAYCRVGIPLGSLPPLSTRTDISGATS